MEKTFSFTRARGASALAALALAYLSGCASISVQNTAVHRRQEPASPPKKIYVMDFDTNNAPFRVNEKDPGPIKVRTAAAVSDTTVKWLDKNIAPALRVGPGKFAATDGWLITGRFEKVNSGSATLRILLGTGAGGSKMNTIVNVYDLHGRGKRKEPFLSFTTTGGSGAVPGLVTIPLSGPIGLPLLIYDVASKVYGEENHGLKDDSARTARMIAAEVSDYMQSRGFPLKGKPMKPKRTLQDSIRSPL